MKRFLLFLLLGLVASAESSPRTWTSHTGSTIEATLVKHEGNAVSLKMTSGKVLSLKTTDLSSADQAYLQELVSAQYGSEIPGIDAQPGSISGPIKCASSQWTYHAYLPKKFHTGRKWPVWFIMSAGGGKGGKPIQRYKEGAETLGCIVITSVESKNGFKQSQAAVKAMAEDVYERFPVEEGFAFSSGMSGGSRMSYLLAEMNQNLAGVLACGSGDGVYPDKTPFRQAKLRSSTYVYSLIGTNCFNRTGAYESHTAFPNHFRLRYFPGKHVWADSALISEGMMRVMGQALLDNDDLAAHKPAYLAALQSMTEDLMSTKPWESYYLASFGAELDARFNDRFFTRTSSTLAKDPKVQLALEAEKDILKLCKDFYLKYNYFKGDTKDLPKRTKAAQELADKYSSIPHGELLSLMGEKSPGPKGK